jgi:DNA gyrase subunit A
LSVEEADELMLMTDGGQSIRIRVSDVRETGRNAQGVKLVTLNKGEKLQAVARVMPDDESDEESEEDETEVAGNSGSDS